MATSQYESYRPPPHKTKAFRVLTEEELKQLERLCEIQCIYDQICKFLGISKATLVRMRKDDPRVLMAMDKGYAVGRVRLRKWMFAQAEHHDGILIFLAKNILGYRD